METAQSGNQVSVGPKLRQAREGRGLSVNDAAQALRLSPRIVSALEEDAYERLPGPTYVRGYLRNYAQFLGLSPQPLVDAYNNSPQAAQRTDMTSPAPVRQITSSDILVRLGTVAVAVIVFGLAALWWSGHEAANLNRFVPTRTAPQPAASDASAPEQPEPSAAVKAPEQAPAPPTQEPSESVKPAVTPAEAPEAPTAAPTAAAAPQAAPDAEDTPAATSATDTPPPDANEPLARLVLYVHDDSWADVRDAQQRRLLYETIPAGRVVTVEGAAPLSVFLGNVEGVTVEFNGKVYDAMRYKRGQVARFTLGSPQG
jgi:cytoskeleton protein RodZ